MLLKPCLYVYQTSWHQSVIADVRPWLGHSNDGIAGVSALLAALLAARGLKLCSRSLPSLRGSVLGPLRAGHVVCSPLARRGGARGSVWSPRRRASGGSQPKPLRETQLHGKFHHRTLLNKQQRNYSRAKSRRRQQVSQENFSIFCFIKINGGKYWSLTL